MTYVPFVSAPWQLLLDDCFTTVDCAKSTVLVLTRVTTSRTSWR